MTTLLAGPIPQMPITTSTTSITSITFITSITSINPSISTPISGPSISTRPRPSFHTLDPHPNTDRHAEQYDQVRTQLARLYPDTKPEILAFIATRLLSPDRPLGYVGEWVPVCELLASSLKGKGIEGGQGSEHEGHRDHCHHHQREHVHQHDRCDHDHDHDQHVRNTTVNKPRMPSTTHSTPAHTATVKSTHTGSHVAHIPRPHQEVRDTPALPALRGQPLNATPTPELELELDDPRVHAMVAAARHSYMLLERRMECLL